MVSGQVGTLSAISFAGGVAAEMGALSRIFFDSWFAYVKVSGMSATDVAAWVGAASGIGAILWDFYKWKTSGPKLTISANPGMKMISGGPLAKHDSGDYLTIWVRNSGTTKTTLTTVCLATYESWWARRRLKQTKAGVVPQPLGNPIPFKLDVGEEWAGSVKQDESIEGMLQTGNMWCDVYHSWSKRPAQVRVKPKNRRS